MMILVASFAATLCCWYRIIRSRDILFFKVSGLLISAIPLLGPIFYLIFDLPPRLPPDAQAKLGTRTGTTGYDQIRDDLLVGNHKYISEQLGKKNRRRRER